MEWDVEFDDDFAAWFEELDEHEADAILAHAILLRTRGPHLGRPYVDRVKGSGYTNMKELRIQIDGDPWRILFAFDPRRVAIFLVGGNKGGDNRWYKTHIPLADERFKQHLERLDRPGQ